MDSWRPHPYAPERDPHKHHGDRRDGKQENRKGRRKDRRPDKGPDALFIVEESKEQGGHGVYQHRSGIEQRQRPAAYQRGGLRKAGSQSV